MVEFWRKVSPWIEDLRVEEDNELVPGRRVTLLKVISKLTMSALLFDNDAQCVRRDQTLF